MAERLPRYQQTGIQIDPYRASGLPSIDYSPLMRASKSIASAQTSLLDRVINYADKLGTEKAEEGGRASVDTPEKARQLLESTKETGMPRTIYDKAAYEQANELVALQLQNDGRRIISEEVRAFKNDPNANPQEFLQKVTDVGYGLESLTTLLDPKLRGRIASDLKRVGDVGFLEISDAYNDRVGRQIQATAVAGIDQRSNDIIRLMASGMNNAEFLVFNDANELRKYAIANRRDPVEVERIIQNTLEQAHIARLMKEYEKAPNKAEFLKRVQADLGAGPIGDLYDKDGTPLKQNRITRGIDANKMGALVNQIEADLRSRAAISNQLRSELKQDITEITKIFTLGQTPSEGVVTDIVNRARRLGLSPNDPTMRRVNYLSELRQEIIGFNKMSPVQLNEWINDKQSQLGAGATVEQSELIKVARESLANKISMLDKDPVTLMANTNFAPVKVIDFGAARPDLEKQIGERIAQSKPFAASMNSDVRYFSQSEANALTVFFNNATPNRQIETLDALATGFGKDINKAIREISKTAPELSYIASLSVSGGVQNRQVVMDALNGLRLIKEGNKPFEATGDTSFKKNVIAQQLGNAFASNPITRNALLATTEAIYANRAITAGKTTFDESMWKKSFQQASGAIQGADGNLYGGIIEYRGNHIPIPTNIRQDRFRYIIETATYDDFMAASNGVPQDSQGRQYSVDRLRKSYPIFIDTNIAVLSFDNPAENTGSKLNGFLLEDKQTTLQVDFKKLADIVKAKENVKYRVGPLGQKFQ